MSFLETNIIRDDQTYDYSSEFQWFFNQLLEVKSGDEFPYEKDTFKKLQELIQQCDKLASELEQLPFHKQYSRNVIGEKDSWNALLSRWEPNVASSVHGHPALAFYYVLEGEFEMDFYKKVSATEVKFSHTKHLKKGDCVWSQGKQGEYDNMIHCVRSLKSSYSLHLFEGDPQKGEVFKIA